MNRHGLTEAQWDKALAAHRLLETAENVANAKPFALAQAVVLIDFLTDEQYEAIKKQEPGKWLQLITGGAR